MALLSSHATFLAPIATLLLEGTEQLLLRWTVSRCTLLYRIYVGPALGFTAGIPIAFDGVDIFHGMIYDHRCNVPYVHQCISIELVRSTSLLHKLLIILLVQLPWFLIS